VENPIHYKTGENAPETQNAPQTVTTAIERNLIIEISYLKEIADLKNQITEVGRRKVEILLKQILN
jgi:hypothetical protein